MKIAIAVLFVLTYVLIIALPSKKAITTGIIAVVSAVLLLCFKTIGFSDLLRSIKYDVILMLFGIMLTVGFFSESGMPNFLSEKLIGKMPNSLIAITLLAVLSGVISAFVDNVATVLMLAPIGIAVAKKIGISPVSVIIAIAVSSNLQGAATLVGDTTSIMLADFAGMSFSDFFFMDGKFSIFWAVEIAALLTVPILLFIFRKDNKKMEYVPEKVVIKSYVPTVLLCLTLVTLITFSFLPLSISIAGIDITNGVICMFYGLIALIFCSVRDKQNVFKATKRTVDLETILFLTALFIIIGCVEKVGLIEDICSLFIKIGGGNIFLLYTVIVFASVILSAFIDNIPYVATMLPVIRSISTTLTGFNPTVLYFGLLIGATLGGNLTPFGASANVVGIGLLKKEGYTVKNSDFFKIGLPFTTVAVLAGYGFCWLVWGI